MPSTSSHPHGHILTASAAVPRTTTRVHVRHELCIPYPTLGIQIIREQPAYRMIPGAHPEPALPIEALVIVSAIDRPPRLPYAMLSTLGKLHVRFLGTLELKGSAAPTAGTTVRVCA